MENRNMLFEPNISNMDDDFSQFLGIGKGKVKSKFKKAKAKAKTKINKAKANVKRVTTSIKKKIGNAGKNFRNKFRSVLRKDILSKISRNIHGTATKLYPAIAPKSELSKRGYKTLYTAKSQKVYSDLLKKWISLGGNEAELKAAIINGQSKKRFLKNPYKSFSGENDSYSFYSYFSSVDGDSTEGVIDEEAGVEEVFAEDEKQKGIRGFFAWLKSVFSKNGANENPYEVGSVNAKYFNDDYNEDKGNEPLESEANNDVIKEIVDTSTTDDAGGDTDEAKKEEEEDEESDDTILGIEKKTFWIGTSVVAVLAIGTFAYFKWIKK